MSRPRFAALSGSMACTRVFGALAAVLLWQVPLLAAQQPAPKPKTITVPPSVKGLPTQPKLPAPVSATPSTPATPIVIRTAPLVLNAQLPAAPIVIRTEPLILNAALPRSKP